MVIEQPQIDSYIIWATENVYYKFIYILICSWFLFYFFIYRAEGSNLLLDPFLICKKPRRLRGKYYEMCKNETLMMHEISRGISMGFKECEYQFKNHRWNCTTNVRSMRKILLRGKNKRNLKRSSPILSKISFYLLWPPCLACQFLYENYTFKWTKPREKYWPLSVHVTINENDFHTWYVWPRTIFADGKYLENWLLKWIVFSMTVFNNTVNHYHCY